MKTETDNNLIVEAKSLHSLIHREDCFSMKDLCRLEAIYSELERRGYEINETSTVEITKED
jgi:hypothetical protein